MGQELFPDLPMSLLRPNKMRGQLSDEAMLTLKQSIERHGLLNPILVSPTESDGSRRILDGDCRFFVGSALGWKTIAGIVGSGDLTIAGSIQRGLISNCHRQELTPLEIAGAIRNLKIETGWNSTRVAAETGFSLAKVSRFEQLLGLSGEIQDHIQAGRIPVSCGSDLARIDDETDRAILAEQIVRGELTRDGLSGLVKKRLAPHADKKKAVPRVTAALGEGRTITLAGNGLDSLETLIAWLEELLRKARQLRPKGIELSTFIRILRDESKAT